ncbi:hypothetical protein ACOSQ4_016452 [Xanthoceras sorbifolium]
MCFGHFLDVPKIVFSGQFCHHILLRECHVENAENEMWFLIGGNKILFSANKFYLVSGLHLGDTVVPTTSPKEDDPCRIRQKYFKGAKKVTGFKLQSLFEHRLEEENDDDDDMIKLALLLILEMTLLGKELRTKVEYWVMKLVDNLEEFNQFPWGSYVYSRTFNSLSTCCKGRDQSFMEKAKKDPSHTAEKINLYGFVYAFQVDSNEVGEEKENDDFFDTTENVNDTCGVKNKEEEEEKAPDECLELSIYSSLPNIVSTIGNQSVVALEKKAVGVRYGGRRRKRSAYECSPYVDPTGPKKQKRRNVNPISFDPLKPVH